MSDDPVDRIGAIAMALEALFARFEGAYNSLHSDVTDLPFRSPSGVEQDPRRDHGQGSRATGRHQRNAR
jgi:hypothetical protein